MKKITKAIIPAAGLGTRFLPATKAQPKEMLPIIDKPIIQYIVEEAIQSGINNILIVTGRNKRAIEDHFDKSLELEVELEKKKNQELLKVVQDISNLANIYYIRQKEAKGLGHAVYCAKEFIGNEPFAVMLGDDIVDAKKPCLKQMIEKYETLQSTILGAKLVERQEVCKYGIISAIKFEERLYEVHNLIEKPKVEDAPSNIAIVSRYILEPEIFDCIERTNSDARGEIQLTDALKLLLQKQKMYAYNFEGERYDAGDKLGYLKATIEYALKRDDLNQEFMQYLKDVITKNER